MRHIYGNIRSVPPFRVNISGPEAHRKMRQRQVAERIGAVAFLPIYSEIWTLKFFLHNTTLWIIPRTNVSVTPTHAIFIALPH